MEKKAVVPHKVKLSKQDKLIIGISYAVVTLFALTCLLPLINLFAKAVSSEDMVLSGKVGLLPKEFQLESILFILKQGSFQRSFLNSVFVTGVTTALTVAVTVGASYPLSIRSFPGRRVIQFMLTFTMIFSGGTIPWYILMRSLNLVESHWGLILPALVVPYWIIIMRSGFEALPESIAESARIDGASHFQVFRYIELPLVKAQIATMTLMCAVDSWNAYFEPMLLLHKREGFTLQVYLQIMLTQFAQSNLVNATQAKQLMNQAPITMQGAAVLLSILPILFLYPVLQKYFVQGMTLGAVKG